MVGGLPRDGGDDSWAAQSRPPGGQGDEVQHTAMGDRSHRAPAQRGREAIRPVAVGIVTAPQSHPFTLRIFLPDGDPAGLRLVDKSQWTGCGLVCPRALFPAAKSREELGRAGVYVLVGPSEDSDLPTIYIGQGDPVRSRLEHHYATRDFWTWAVVFVSKDGSLNTAHVQYLEARLIQRARDVRRANLENQNTPREPTLAEAERMDVESFLADMLSLLPVLGLSVFEPTPAAAAGRSALALQSQKATARGYDSPQGFVVTAGSEAAPTSAPSARGLLSGLRKDLLAQGVLTVEGDHLVFAQDYVFSSPSTAAGVVLGREANGRTAWKDEQGRTLREIQEAESAG